MNTLTITTPAVLFSSISLLFLAYTQRFLSLANLIRQLYKDRHDEFASLQIQNLQHRIYLMRQMQVFGVISYILCGTSMISIYFKLDDIGNWLFCSSIFSLIISLVISLREVWISTGALDIALSEINKI